MSSTVISVVSNLLHSLIGISDRNEIVLNIQKIATQINTQDTEYTAGDLFNALLNDVMTTPVGDTETQFVKLIAEFIHAFDADGDGKLTGEDVELFKLHPVENIMSALTKIIVVLSMMDKKIFTVKLTPSVVSNVIYRIVLYSLFLPLTTNNAGFREFITEKNGGVLISDVLNLIKMALDQSQPIKDIIQKILDSQKNGCFLTKCCRSSKSSEDVKEDYKVELFKLRTQTPHSNWHI